MQWIEPAILSFSACVAAECCSPGHIHMARCIRLLFVAPMYDISTGNAICAICPGAYKSPGFFVLRFRIVKQHPIIWKRNYYDEKHFEIRGSRPSGPDLPVGFPHRLRAGPSKLPNLKIMCSPIWWLDRCQLLPACSLPG